MCVSLGFHASPNPPLELNLLSENSKHPLSKNGGEIAKLDVLAESHVVLQWRNAEDKTSHTWDSSEVWSSHHLSFLWKCRVCTGEWLCTVGRTTRAHMASRMAVAGH